MRRERGGPFLPNLLRMRRSMTRFVASLGSLHAGLTPDL
jgi:hypothetical protein